MTATFQKSLAWGAVLPHEKYMSSIRGIMGAIGIAPPALERVIQR